jgi:plastocyanin
MFTTRNLDSGRHESGHQDSGHQDSGHHAPVRSRWRGRVLTALGIVALAAGLAACGSTSPKATSGSAPAGGTTGASSIAIKNFAFAPDVLTVKAGATVSVKNEDGVTHTLTSTTGKFSTGDVASGQTVSFTAPETPGTYAYRCNIHQYMTGTLVVRAG